MHAPMGLLADLVDRTSRCDSSSHLLVRRSHPHMADFDRSEGRSGGIGHLVGVRFSLAPGQRVDTLRTFPGRVKSNASGSGAATSDRPCRLPARRQPQDSAIRAPSPPAGLGPGSAAGEHSSARLAQHVVHDTCTVWLSSLRAHGRPPSRRSSCACADARCRRR